MKNIRKYWMIGVIATAGLCAGKLFAAGEECYQDVDCAYNEYCCTYWSIFGVCCPQGVGCYYVQEGPYFWGVCR